MAENKGRKLQQHELISYEVNKNWIAIAYIISRTLKEYREMHEKDLATYVMEREHICYKKNHSDGKGYEEEAKAIAGVRLIINDVKEGMILNFNLMNAPEEEEIKKRIELELEYIRTKKHMEALQEKRKAYESGRL